MAVLSCISWNSQQRVDLSHLRGIESGVRGDFDLLAGTMMAAQQPVVISGFTIPMTTAIGSPATQLQLTTAGGALINQGASASGSIFASPVTATTELLTSTNPNVQGAWTANSTNYIGLDLARSPAATTATTVQFLSMTTGQEVAEIVPLRQLLNYVVVISPNSFASTTNVCPVAKVVTDANNNVVSVQDCRNVLWRLGSGGDSPNVANTYSWPSRAENPDTSTSTTSPFLGGDKQLASLRDFIEAIETRAWELGGGEYWYSATADRNVKLTRESGVYPGGYSDNFGWNSGTSTLAWAGLKIVWPNSTGYNNIVAAGTAVLATGQCLYVDLNRAVNGATVTPVVGTLTTLGSPTIPGSRWVLAWYGPDGVYIRDQPYVVGTTVAVATNLAPGIVQLLTTSPVTPPLVPVVDSNDLVVGTGISRSSVGGSSLTSGAINVATGANDTSLNLGTGSAMGAIAIGTGSATSVAIGTGSSIASVTIGNGSSGAIQINGNGINGLALINASGPLELSTSSGILYAGSNFTLANSTTAGHLSISNPVVITAAGTNQAALTSAGTGTGQGVAGTGGTTGDGVTGHGGSSSGHGIFGQGTGSGTGAVGVGGSSGPGGQFTGGAGSNFGLVAAGTGTAPGATFANGSASIAGSTQYNDVECLQGNIGFPNGSSYDPSGATSFTNTLTPKNICKAFAQFSSETGGGNAHPLAAGVGDHFNIASIVQYTAGGGGDPFTSTGSTIVITLATPMLADKFCVVGVVSSSGPQAFYIKFTSGTLGAGGNAVIVLQALNSFGSGTAFDPNASTCTYNITVYGAQ